jgi:aryl-alcohol dehydrogenase-like predicted oxidoreductase
VLRRRGGDRDFRARDAVRLPPVELDDAFGPHAPGFEVREANLALVAAIGRIGERLGATPAQVALAWLLARKPWIVPIPGTTKEHRLRENLAALDLALDADDLREIDAVTMQVPVLGARYPENFERMIDR